MEATSEISLTEAAGKDRGKGLRMEVPFVDLKAQYARIAREVNGGIKEVLDGSDFILGRKVREFEESFAVYCGTSYTAGVASGTDALHLALKAFGVGPGDEVITQANTFIATLLAISYTGARPVLVDVDPETCNIDPEKLCAAVTAKTRAIVPVHLYGRPAPMDAVMELAGRHGIYVVEDACQAHGACHEGKEGRRRVGSIGNAAAFSFYPGKNLGAYGDGGMVATNSRAVAERVRMLRDYGQAEKYHHASQGFNSRLDTMQAAVLLAKLEHLDEWNAMRMDHARRYRDLLCDVPEITLPDFDPGRRLSHVFHLFVVRAEERDGLREHLSERRISTGIHYPVPCHLQEAYRGLGYKPGSFPVTEDRAGAIVSLPIFPELRDEQIRYVVESVRDFYGR